MKTLTPSNIHGRINYRGNLEFKDKAYNLPRVLNIFTSSFGNGDDDRLTSSSLAYAPNEKVKFFIPTLPQKPLIKALMKVLGNAWERAEYAREMNHLVDFGEFSGDDYSPDYGRIVNMFNLTEKDIENFLVAAKKFEGREVEANEYVWSVWHDVQQALWELENFLRFEKIIDLIENEVDYVPDSERSMKSYPHPYNQRALKALQRRRMNFHQMGESKKLSFQ